MLHARLPTWEQSMLREDRVLWGYQDHSFVQPYMSWLKWYWKRNEKWQVRIQLFSNQSDIETGLKNKVPLRTIRPFPAPFQFDSSIWVCGEYIIMLVTNQLPHFAFELRDARFARSLRSVFQLLWGMRLDSKP